MNLLEFLSEQNENNRYTFTICECERESTNLTNKIYRQTPIRAVWEWEYFDIANNFIVINKDHPPIDITGHWVTSYNQGHLKNCIITTEKDLIEEYGEKQGREMIEYYDKKVRYERKAN